MAQKERWNEIKTKAFISLYLSKPALWDSSSPEYCQKTEKNKAYEALMDQFGLTLNEVRNKIRIYRTTYMQEKNKEATVSNYVPRLSWYNDMKETFKVGHAKSFAKSTGTKKIEVLNKSVKKEKQHIPPSASPTNVQYELLENDIELDESNNLTKSDNSSLPTHIIIEPYDEQEEEEINVRETTWSKSPQSSDTKKNSLLSSNELFLQSLKSTLDKLPEEKNMRARIKIQEVLYTIMYEKP